MKEKVSKFFEILNDDRFTVVRCSNLFGKDYVLSLVGCKINGMYTNP